MTKNCSKSSLFVLRYETVIAVFVACYLTAGCAVVGNVTPSTAEVEWTKSDGRAAGILADSKRIAVIQSTQVDGVFANKFEADSGKKLRIIEIGKTVGAMTGSQFLETLRGNCENTEAVLAIRDETRQDDNKTLGMAGGYIMGRVNFNYRFLMHVLDCRTGKSDTLSGIGKLSAATFEMANPQASARLGGEALSTAVLKLVLEAAATKTNLENHKNMQTSASDVNAPLPPSEPAAQVTTSKPVLLKKKK